MSSVDWFNASVVDNALQNTLIKDRYVLKRQWNQFAKNTPSNPADKDADIKNHQAWQKWQQRLECSQAAVNARKASVPTIKYPSLPVSDRRDEILALIEANQVIVVAGETGSGKTTQIPKMCLEAGRGVFGRIGCTQPRRLAARSVAERLAEELNTPLGEKVGYQVRFHDQTREDSLIKVMTDGVLLAELQNDRFLNQYDTIIIDEAHERSINIDFLLGILKTLLKKRPDLKVVITSATIDTDRFSQFFDNAPVIEVSGRTYPVEIRYRPLTQGEDDQGQTFEQDMPTAIADALEELAQVDPFGDVLVFQVGERDIKETAETLRKLHLKNTEIVPLYARLSMAEQNKVFQTSSKRRIILATNVAETSLTVPGIKFVIDPGLVRISRYSVRTKVQRLPVERISQASANQRAGRCGRVSEGVCIRLYDEADFQSRSAFTAPEIHRTSLATVILQMMQLRLGEVKHFPFIEPPEDKAINDGFRQLHELGALDDQRRLTESGRQIARLPLDPKMAKILLEGQKNGVLYEVLVIATALSVQDPREGNEATRQAANKAHQPFEDTRSDFLFFLNLWRFYEDKRRHLSQSKLRKLCKTNWLSYIRMKEWHDLFVQIESSLKQTGFKLGEPHLYEEVLENNKPVERLSDLHTVAVHRSLMAGFLGNLATRGEENSYLGARNTRLFIHPSSVLFKQKPKWFMSAELVETTKLYARTNAAVDVRWVESLAGHLVKRSYADPHWQKKKGQVGAYESVTLYGLPIVNRRPCNYGPIHPKESRKIFIRHALVEGDMNSRVPFFVHNQQLVADIERIESKLRRLDYLVDDNVLYDFYDEHLPKHIYNQPALETWVKKMTQENSNILEELKLNKETLLKQSVADDLSHQFPDALTLKNRLELNVDYKFDPGKKQDGMVVTIPLSTLNLVQDADFEWLTPGLIAEKVATYIKALPKSLRKQFIPAPQYASLALQDMSPEKMIQGRKQPFLHQLVWALNRRAAQAVSLSDFEAVALPEHLKPYFVLQDDKGKPIAESDSLQALKQDYQHLVDQRIQTHQAKQPTETKVVTTWDFGDLENQKTIKTKGVEMVAYPALQLNGSTIELTLIGDKESADDEHRKAVLKLLATELADKDKYLQKKLPLQKACLCYAPYGTCQDLTQQVIDRALVQLVPDAQSIRTQTEYEQTLARVRSEWVNTAQAIAKHVNDVLSAHQTIAKQVKGKTNPRWLASLADIRHQLDGLISKGFVRDMPEQWFQQLPRYLQGLEKRLEKIDIDPNKDQKAIRELQPILDKFEQIAKEPAYQNHPGLVEIRWQIEELRLSLFSQPMKTLKPVSIKRIEKALTSF